MPLSLSYEAALRSLDREYRDTIAKQQRAFREKSAENGALNTGQFRVGIAEISAKAAVEYVRRALAECLELQDVTNASDFEDTHKAIVGVARNLSCLGLQGPEMRPSPNPYGGHVLSELESEVRDQLIVCQDRQRSKGKSSRVAWTLLFLQANPLDTPPLSTNSEYRELRQALRESNYRDQVMPVIEAAVRVRDIFRAVNEHRPRVIHFSGHGNVSSLALLNSNDEAKEFDGQYLADLIAANDDQVQLVVFNACDSHSQALKLLQAVPHVIGTTGPVDDQSAIVFSRAFYNAIGNGRSIASCFKQAQAALNAEVGPGMSQLYQLDSKCEVDAAAEILVKVTGDRSEPLSRDEQELLSAVPATGEIHIVQTNQKGRWVRAGKIDFFEPEHRSVSANKLEALESLIAKGLARHESEILYTLTGTGWKAKKELG